MVNRKDQSLMHFYPSAGLVEKLLDHGINLGYRNTFKPWYSKSGQLKDKNWGLLDQGVYEEVT